MSAITVYGIWHRFTQQVYVGHSVSTERRFAMHRNSLRRGDHHCIHLQRAWNLYGDGAFDFRPIQVCATKDEAIRVEQQMLDAFFDTGRLYNSARSNEPREVLKAAHTPAARATNAGQMSDARTTARQANIRKTHTPEAIARRVAATHKSGKWCAGLWTSVVAFRLGTGEFVLCHSVAEAARITGAGRGNVTSCLAGRRTQAAGYLFVKDVQ